MLMLKALSRSLFQIAFFAAVLLIPAGTWHWPRAIQFLAVFAALSLILIEEKNLREHLPGCADYMTRVPHRLVPRIW